MRQQTGEHNRTVADYTEAIRIDPGYTRAYAHRPAACGTIGKKAEAEADRTKARELGFKSE